MSSNRQVSIRIAIDVPAGVDVQTCTETPGARVPQMPRAECDVHHITVGPDPSVQLGVPRFTITGGYITITCDVTITGFTPTSFRPMFVTIPLSPPTALQPTFTLGNPGTLSVKIPVGSPLVGTSAVLGLIADDDHNVAGDSKTVIIPVPSPHA